MSLGTRARREGVRYDHALVDLVRNEEDCGIGWTAQRFWADTVSKHTR